MTDRDFDLLLEEEISALPPGDDTVADITPWRRAVHRILWGMGLCGITLNFLLLDHILPAIGVVLILLGFRSLRRENGWFRLGYIAAVIRTVLYLLTTVIDATIWNAEIYDLSAVSGVLTAAAVVIPSLHALCICAGFRDIQRKAGIDVEHRGYGLVVYYVILTALALMEFQGSLVVLALLVIYILLLRSLWKFAHSLEEAGYALQASPVRLSDRALALLLALIAALGIACGYLFCSQYPMDWRPQETVSAEAEAVREDLLALGFPADVLNDLTQAELLACRGAAAVHVKTQEEAVNDGVHVTESDGFYTYHHTEYPVKELRITHVAVEIPGSPRQFVLIQHFLWQEDPGFRGTDAIQLWPAWDDDGGWILTSDYSGRVLCDRDNVSYVSPYHSLGPVTGTSDTMFWGEQTATDIIAAFSLPRDGVNSRGYTCYTVAEGTPGHILDAWFNYYYQESPLQYPVRTAADTITPGWSGNRGCCNCVSTALQMCYDTQKAEEEGIYEFHIIG